jgi:hypothetical protein
MGDEGRELSTDSSGKTATADVGAALLRAVADSDLAAVVAAWPSLSAKQRAAIGRITTTNH